MQANQLNKNAKDNSRLTLCGRPAEILALKDAVSKDPNNIQNLIRLGRLLVESQKFDEAVEIHQKIYELEPRDPRNSNSLGVTLMIAGYQAQAIEYLEKTVRLAANNVVFKANLGKAYMMARHWQKALECIESVLTVPGIKGEEQLKALKQECLLNLKNSPIDSVAEKNKAIPDNNVSDEKYIHEDPQKDSTARQTTAITVNDEEVLPQGPDENYESQDTHEKTERDVANDVMVLKDKKILHAPFEIAGNMARFVKYLRGKGLEADDANYYDTWLGYQNSISLNINKLPESQQLKVVQEFAASAMKKYDIFHFHFGQSLFPDLRDLPELSRRGKKILFSFWGSDQRSPEWIYYQQAKFLGYSPPKPFYLTKASYRSHRIINMFADVVFGMVCIPRGLFYSPSIDISQWDLKDKETLKVANVIHKDKDKIYIVHAPTSQWKKGTSIIINRLNKLRQEGMPIEIMQVSGLEPQKAKALYAHADFALDQVGVGTFGLFALEMMSWKIPTMAYQIPLMDRIRNNPPILKITTDSLRETIEYCLKIKGTDEYDKIGNAGREWVTQNCDVSVWLDKYLAIYADLIQNKKIPQIVNTSWFREETRLQSGDKSEFYRYMIDNKVFDEIGIQVPQYDRDMYA